MLLLVGLVIGLICGLAAAKAAGFVSSWVRLFNTAVAVYVTVYTTPMLVSSVTLINEHTYGPVLSAIVISVVTFIILNSICMVVMGELKIEMPKLLDGLGGGAMGFANGMLVWGFLLLLLSISPLAASSMVKQVCSEDEVQQLWLSSVGTSVAALDFITFQNEPPSLCKVVEQLAKAAQPKPKPGKEKPATPTDETAGDTQPSVGTDDMSSEAPGP